MWDRPPTPPAPSATPGRRSCGRWPSRRPPGRWPATPWPPITIRTWSIRTPGKPFGAPPPDVAGPRQQQLLSETARRSTPSRRASDCLAAARQSGAALRARRLRLVLPGAHVQRQCRRRPHVHLAALRPGLHQCGFQQQSFEPAAAVSRTVTLGYVPRTPTSQLSDRVAGPDYRVPVL